MMISRMEVDGRKVRDVDRTKPLRLVVVGGEEEGEGEEEDENLSRILRVCLRASRRRYLLRRDLSRVVEAFYAVVVRGNFFLGGNQD